jgi:hypothetical protein
MKKQSKQWTVVIQISDFMLHFDHRIFEMRLQLIRYGVGEIRKLRHGRC